MARRMDRRVQRTRKLLRESLMALILEEGYDAVSIQDITDKANLGRATFYLHFKDKDELLLDVMGQFISEFLDSVPQFSPDQWCLEDNKSIIKVFDFAAEHYDLYRILIIGSGGITASRQLHQSIAENIKACIQKEIEELNTEPIIPAHFIANYFAGSLLATIYWWLDQDLPYTVNEMADMFQKINMLDRDALMGLGEADEDHEKRVEKRKKKKPSKDRNHSKKERKATINDAEGKNPEALSD
jgi:AcrR family transcriptional regulator